MSERENRHGDGRTTPEELGEPDAAVFFDYTSQDESKRRFRTMLSDFGAIATNRLFGGDGRDESEDES
jgi:hypothetical protein